MAIEKIALSARCTEGGREKKKKENKFHLFCAGKRGIVSLFEARQGQEKGCVSLLLFFFLRLTTDLAEHEISLEREGEVVCCIAAVAERA